MEDIDDRLFWYLAALGCGMLVLTVTILPMWVVITRGS